MGLAKRWLGVAAMVAWTMCLASCGAAGDAKDAAAPTTDAPQGDARADETKAETPGEEKAPEPVDMKKVSYCIGLSIGRNAKSSDVALDATELVEGLKAGIGEGTPRFTDADVQKIMTAFQESLMVQQTAKAKKTSEENTAKGETYLAENQKKDGVTTTASGLQYRVIKAGAGGKQPKPADTVTVHYKGRLIDGKQFDSSYDRGEPATFEVGGVIPGWTEALQLMREGDVWEVVIPSALAYGERGAGPIAPNSVLVFEVELQKVEEPKAEKETPKDAPAPEKEPPKTEK